MIVNVQFLRSRHHAVTGNRQERRFGLGLVCERWIIAENRPAIVLRVDDAVDHR